MSEPLLHHHGDRVPQRRTAHRARVRVHRHRRDRPLQAARRLRRALPDRHRRARPEDGRDRRGRGHPDRGAGAAQLRRVRAAAGAARHLLRPVHPHHRCRPHRGLHRDLEADGRQPATSTWTPTRAGTRCATRPSSPRPRPRVGADGTRVATETGAPVDLDRGADLLLPAVRLRRTSCSPTTRSIPSSSGPTCGATRWSASSPADCATCRSRAPRSTGACRCPTTPTT